MNAVILSAGLGTRLLPLTTIIPKPLLPVANRPLIDLLVDNLKGYGFTRFGINLHHLPEKIKAHLEGKGDEYYYSFEPVILDTGGGIARFADFLRDDDFFLVHNGDIVSNIDISGALAFHREQRALATLVLVDSHPTNVVKVSSNRRIIDIRNRLGACDDTARMLTFSGIALYDSRILSRMPEGSIFSIVDFLLEEIGRGDDPVMGYVPDARYYWKDVGSITSYMELHRDILTRRAFQPGGMELPSDGILIADDARISETSTMEGFAAISRGARIEEHAHLKDVCVFPDTVVPSGVRATNAIFAGQLMVEVQNDGSR